MSDEGEIKKESPKRRLNRRDFLQGLATLPVLGAFAWALNSKNEKFKRNASGESPKTIPNGGKDELNVALIGAGAQGNVLINSCLLIPGIRFKAVCDIWSDYNLKRASGILKKFNHEVNSYEDYEEMLSGEKDLDAVIVATPDFWHAKHTIACLESGINVYCEKEMSNTLEEARQMVVAARNSGKLLQIGHQRRSNPLYLHCYNKLIKEAGLIGRITAVNGQWNRSFQPDLGWPAKLAIPESKLIKYGFKSMNQFRNWRWFKGLGGGPIVDLGSHQIDIYNWFLGANPSSVMASGGIDYYDKLTHEWYDTIMTVFEYKTGSGNLRALYQTINTNNSQGYFETFMGEKGTICTSESASRGGIYREPSAPAWDEWVNKGLLTAPFIPQNTDTGDAILDVRESVSQEKYGLPLSLTDPYHKPHLENFFNAVRGIEKLNCPAETGYETAVAVLKVNEAVEKGMILTFDPDEFKV
jgi:predicted dehydrogenase